MLILNLPISQDAWNKFFYIVENRVEEIMGRTDIAKDVM